jgi:hypothetical protein
MPATLAPAPVVSPGAFDAARLEVLILTRIHSAANGATDAEVGRDVMPHVSHRLSPAEWRTRLGHEIVRLEGQGLVKRIKLRWHLTPKGVSHYAAMLPKGLERPGSWEDANRQHLAATALGLDSLSPRRAKLLAAPRGLAMLIVEAKFHLRLKAAPTPARVRAALAIVALEKAFGNKIKSGLGAGAGLSAKAGRLLAGQLAHRPRDFGTDSRLIAALAAEAVGAHQTTDAALRAALLRQWLNPADVAPAPVVIPARSAPAAPRPRPAAKPATITTLPGERPDLDRFAIEVKAAARLRAEGWAGARKAFISHVYQSLSELRPEWRLTEIEFKGMLAEAHRAGRIVLANADLKDKSVIKDLQESALPYKNTVWHQVRIED